MAAVPGFGCGALTGTRVDRVPCCATVDLVKHQDDAEPAVAAEEAALSELRLIQQAEAEADAGLLIPQADINAWIDSLLTGNPLPPPEPRKQS